jgi:PASTA domain-containing protein
MGWKNHMSARTIDLITKGSVILAALILSACGGGSDSGGNNSGGSVSVSVPNVVGDTQAAASTAITGAGLTVGTVTTQSSSTVTSGDVISENPAASSTVTKGSAVALVVSSGSAPVSVPNVVGDTQAAASTAITGAALMVGNVTTQSSSTVVAGKVISENPAAATSVAKGSAVALIVSSGPTNYTVGGTLIGLGAGATVQVLNGTATLPVSANGSFTLPTGLLAGGAYAVTVGTPTTTPAQTCNVQNASGTVTTANVTNVVVYCTYTVTVATLNGTYTTAVVVFDAGSTPTSPPTIEDASVVATYTGTVSSPNYSGSGTFNVDNGDIEHLLISDVYAVTTTNGIANLTNDAGLSGGIEGVDANAVNGVNVNAIQPGMSVGVLPDPSGTTASIDGDYTLVNITGTYATEAVSVYDATITVANGAVTGTYVENNAGTITTGNPFTGTWSVTNGAITVTAYGSGAVSADGDLIVLSNDAPPRANPSIEVAVRRGTGVANATFEGVYSVSEYGGAADTAIFAEAITLFAYGNGTYSVTFTRNAGGTVTTNNTDTGTYTIAADGTLTLTGSKGDVYTGALAADGNALVLASVTNTQDPAIFAGLRQ